MENLIVRFRSVERYDITLDERRIQLQATTSLGTYSCDLPIDKKLREHRREFQEYVIECMQKGIEPHECELDG